MATVLSADAVDQAIDERPLRWAHENGTLRKVVKKKNFAEALAFVNEVGALAEARDHHPDIDIRWNTVSLALVTHSAGGITELDLELAGAIDLAEEPELAS